MLPFAFIIVGLALAVCGFIFARDLRRSGGAVPGSRQFTTVTMLAGCGAGLVVAGVGALICSH